MPVSLSVITNILCDNFLKTNGAKVTKLGVIGRLDKCFDKF